jgi:purine-binding chemotaxis protein CheW
MVSSREILRRRARALAAEPRRQAADGPTFTIVEFALAEERYALEMSFVTGVDPLERLTPVPCTPAFLAGIINVRGRIIAVVDLKKFFELPEKGISDLHRVIIVRHHDVELGLVADYVVGTREIPFTAPQPPLPTHTGIRAAYLKGITNDRLILLDAAKILSDPRLIVDETPVLPS